MGWQKGQPLFFLWPTATNVVALRPHQTFQTSFEVRSQGSTLHRPKGNQQQSPLGSPLPFRQHFLKNEKVATEIDPAFNFILVFFGLIRKC
ncbi:hypothetical protein EGC86_01645 [Shewanella frigidimarina]|uniref:hypothetical protein n=1 Tax=Shewanella frigidimarina TaxID=56812 RepID=UPI000FC0A747|nr:hypothetical protein [Shewanella frigidimarina]RPA64002.1 hypothetical protein EGC86_01645 [Shewanella frigidimarina]